MKPTKHYEQTYNALKTFYDIKRRMVELDAIMKVRPEDNAARNELRILKNEFPLAWAEVQ
jgi:hypothetical protein|tara:strand:- start:166 stop:345 length:180 start_codon:yes stop_codon:yes gene_type:complete